MTQTFIHVRIELIEKRFREIEILLEQAVEKKSEQHLYATFCRSAHVLLVAHFEGMVKDIVKDVLDDLNSNITFKELPTQIKRTYCQYYQNKNEKGDYDEGSIKRLIETFDELPTKLKITPFLFENNKNPNPYIIDTILKKFGVTNFFMLLKNSDLDIVFENIKSVTNQLKESLKNYLTENLTEYPYNVNESFYHPESPVSKQSQPRTLWQTFLDDFLSDRHSIVHGNTLENPKDHEEIMEAMVKIHILIYAFIISICRVATVKIAPKEPEPTMVTMEQLDDAEWEQNIEYCIECEESNGMANEVYFGKPQPLIDERTSLSYVNPNQQEFAFAKDLPKINTQKPLNEILVGNCEYCNTIHFICSGCETLNAVLDNEFDVTKECIGGCGLNYFIDTSNDREHIGEGYQYRILNEFEVCKECGEKFTGEEGVTICEDCEINNDQDRVN